MRMFGKLVVAFGAVAFMTAPVLAQGGRGGPGGPGGMMGGGGGTALLTNKGVQAELKLTEEQGEKVNAFARELMEKQRGEREGLRDLSAEERRDKMAEMNKATAATTKAKLAEILKPEQAKRFEQIQIQQAGPQAFAMANVQESLKLTDAQKSTVREINEGLGAQMREAFQEAGDDRQAAMAKMAELRKGAVTKVAATLTDEQKAAWKGLIGDAYEVKIEARPRNN